MKKQSGFTILELMITVLIIGIMATVGMPSLKNFTQGGQLVAASNELTAALHLARSEAIKLNSRVTICSSSDESSCSGSTSWENGWVVFVDSDGNLSGTGSRCSASNMDCLLRVYAGYSPTDIAIRGLNSANVALSSLTFTSRGLPKETSGASQSGLFSICNLDSGGSTTDSRAVVLGLSGRVRISTNAVVTCP